MAYLGHVFLTSHREIDRLRERVKELEGKLGSTTLKHSETENEENCIMGKLKGPCLPTNLDPLGQFGGNKAYYNCKASVTICEL